MELDEKAVEESISVGQAVRGRANAFCGLKRVGPRGALLEQ